MPAPESYGIIISEKSTIGSLFEERVQKSGNKGAVEFNGVVYTYNQLQDLCNSTCNALRSSGVTAGQVVGVFLDSSLEWVVSFYAIQQAGAVYLPLDPKLPAERINHILLESNTVAVIKPTQAEFPSTKQQVALVNIEEAMHTSATHNGFEPRQSEDMAYTIYTSGSTGTPKGIKLCHTGIVNTCRYVANRTGLTETDTLLQLASVSFDPSVMEVLIAIVVGCKLVVAPKEKKMPGEILASLINDRKITAVISATPTALSLMQSSSLPRLSTLLIGGEEVKTPLAAEWMVGRKMFNAYGPAEASVVTTVADLTHKEFPDEHKKIHMGKPIDNVYCLIMDENKQIVQDGVEGELYIGGIGLALGYFSEEKTNANFVNYTDSNGKSHRLYKTGDLVKRLADGNILFIGRVDLQVKIRGQRVELGEIENTLSKFADVKGCVVDVVKDASNNEHLTAFVMMRRRRSRSVPGSPARRAEAEALTRSRSGSNPPVVSPLVLANLTGGTRKRSESTSGKSKALSPFLPIPQTRSRSGSTGSGNSPIIASSPLLSGMGLLPGMAKSEGHSPILSPRGISPSLISPNRSPLMSPRSSLSPQLSPRKRGSGNINAIISHLKQTLPHYMIPSCIIPVETIPHTVNGKVDRAMLKTYAVDYLQDVHSPRSIGAVGSMQLARDIALIWNEALQLSDSNNASTTVTGSFLELGGQSIKATQIITALKKLCDSTNRHVDVPLSFFFEDDADLQKLIHHVHGQITGSSGTTAAKIAALPSKKEPVPISIAQEQILFVKEMHPDHAHFHENVTITLGALQHPLLLKQAFVDLVHRHEILRTTLVPDVSGNNHTTMVQVLHDNAALDWQYTDLSDKDDKEAKGKEIVLQRLLKPFDLAKDMLLRIDLIKYEDFDFRLYLCFHHIIADDVSIYNILLQEVAATYSSLWVKLERRLLEGSDGSVSNRSDNSDGFYSCRSVFADGELLPSLTPRTPTLTPRTPREELKSPRIVVDKLMKLSLELTESEFKSPRHKVEKVVKNEVPSDSESDSEDDGDDISESGSESGSDFEEDYSDIENVKFPTLGVQYMDYAVFERQRYESKAIEDKVAFWKNNLQGVPALTLPTDFARPRVFDSTASTVPVFIDGALADELHRYCKREGVTFYVLLCTAWAMLMSRYSNQTDFALGTTMSARGDKDLENIFGFFVDLVPLRMNLSGEDLTIKTLLNKSKNVLWDAYANKEVPLFRILNEIKWERDLSKNAIFQAGFAVRYETVSSNLTDLGWSATQNEIHNQVTNYDLNLILEDKATCVRGYLEYCTALFEENTIKRMVENYKTLLQSLVYMPSSTRIADLMVLSSNESKLLNYWNSLSAMNSPLRSLCIHQLLERQVELRPNAPVVYVGKQDYLTYEQLNIAANKCARYLQSVGVGPDMAVGICLTRGFYLITVMLAVLKCGAYFVSLDKDYPHMRLKTIIDHAEINVIVTESKLKDKLQGLEYAGKLIVLDLEQAAIQPLDVTNIRLRVPNTSRACILYTSGSTGKPKGVSLEHKGMVNYLIGYVHDVRVDPGMKMLAATTTTFDAGTAEMFMAMVHGGAVEIAPEEIATDSSIVWDVVTPDICAMLTTPTRWKIMTESGWRPHSTMQVVTVGEPLSEDFVKILKANGATVINGYGPTEASIGSTAGFIELGKPISVGRPMLNVTVFVLDEFRRRLPIGVFGEIYIGGAGIGRGYYKPDDPELNNNSFISWQENEDSPIQKLYKTGDYGRIGGDGNLQCVGRINIDTQVKFHGVRIELGEVEKVLELHPEVFRAVVMVYQDRLVAYIIRQQPTDETVVPLDDAKLQLNLRNFVADRLPKTMWVGQYVFLKDFPLTNSGKINRKGFPEPPSMADSAAAREAYVAPDTPAEQLMAQIWGQVLGLDRVGVTENFFHLGGQSVVAVTLVNAINRQFANLKRINLKTVFEYPTIRQLLGVIYGNFKRESVNLAKEASFDEELQEQLTKIHAQTKAPQTQFKPTPTRILLTGATGFLGIFILENLLKDENVKQVYCVVRASDDANVIGRIRETATTYLANLVNMHKIVPVVGDLSKPNLGINPDLYYRLAYEEAVDCIIHNGSCVHFLKPYDVLKADNVGGTREVLKLATKNYQKPIPIHYVSTYAVFGSLGFLFNKSVLHEDETIDGKEDHLFMGYTETKWVSEKMLWKAHALGLPISVFRPALIMGHSVTGRGSTKEAMSLLVKANIQVGCYAKAHNEDKMFVTVDYVANAITTVLLNYDQHTWNGSAYHICNTTRIDYNDFMLMVNQCGYTITAVNSFHKFADAVVADGENNSMFPLLSLLTEPVYKEYTLPEIYQNNATNGPSKLDKLLRDKNVSCPPITLDIVQKWITAWENMGFFSQNDYKPYSAQSRG